MESSQSLKLEGAINRGEEVMEHITSIERKKQESSQDIQLGLDLLLLPSN